MQLCPWLLSLPLCHHKTVSPATVGNAALPCFAQLLTQSCSSLQPAPRFKKLFSSTCFKLFIGGRCGKEKLLLQPHFKVELTAISLNQIAIMHHNMEFICHTHFWQLLNGFALSHTDSMTHPSRKRIGVPRIRIHWSI